MEVSVEVCCYRDSRGKDPVAHRTRIVFGEDGGILKVRGGSHYAFGASAQSVKGQAGYGK